MREAVGIPAGLLVYFLSTVILLFLAEITFANPQDWPRLITVMTAIVSFKIMCATVINFSTKTGIKIVGVLIAIIWLFSLGFDLFAFLYEAVKILSGGYTSGEGIENFKELIGAVWDTRVCAGVTVLLALWTLSK